MITFTGTADTFRATTELTKPQRDLLTALAIDPPKKIIEITTEEPDPPMPPSHNDIRNDFRNDTTHPGPAAIVSRNDFRNDINDAGLDAATRTTIPCPFCRNAFTPIRRQKYCTPACRQAPWRTPSPPRPGASRRPAPTHPEAGDHGLRMPRLRHRQPGIPVVPGLQPAGTAHRIRRPMPPPRPASRDQRPHRPVPQPTDNPLTSANPAA